MDYGRTLELLSYRGQSNLGFLRLEAVKVVVRAHNPVNVKADHKYDRFGTGGAGSPRSGLASAAHWLVLANEGQEQSGTPRVAIRPKCKS